MTEPGPFSMGGKRILVTGAAGHLGRALCGYLLEDGATVFATDLRSVGLESMRSELDPSGNRLFVFPADLSREDERAALAIDVCEASEYLDGAVFAAAFVGTSNIPGWSVPFADQKISSWQAAVDLNLTAPFHLAQLFRSALDKSESASIVNIGSVYASVAPDWRLYEGLSMTNPAAYSASKGGLLQLTRWLATVLSPKIRVNMVSPGGILRGQPAAFVDRYTASVPLGRMAVESDVVGAICFLLSASASYVSGVNLAVDGGFSLR